jgi:pteridine reductase
MSKEISLEKPKTAFITGASRRIGAEIARVLHEQGFNIVLHYNTSAQSAMALCEAFNKKRNNSAMTVQGDLVNIKLLPQLIDQAVTAWGRLDVLVNNASGFYKTPFEQVNEEVWDDLIKTNLQAPLFLSQAAMPHLKETRGCIVNITDVHGERPMRDYSVYCISKAGLIMLTKSLAVEMAPLVRVNAISPGAMLWPEGESNEMTDEIKQKIIKRIALKRPGDALQIAKAVLYFVKDADYVTGQVMAVDGGRSLYM